MTPDLPALIARLEAASEGSAELDVSIHSAATGDLLVPIPRYSTSLDAALTLCPERGESGLLWRVVVERKPVHSGPAWIAEVREHAKDGGCGIANTPALALCIAALRARLAQP